MRLIDADALLEKTIALARLFESNEDMFWYGKNKYVFKGVAYANHFISEAPTIDAVPVEKYNELREAFVDYVCSGVQNPAPYCKNRFGMCVNGFGWCLPESGNCRGFNPDGERKDDD